MARILVVDDNKLLRAIISDALTAGGHHVLMADNGQMALKTIQNETPNLIITDFYMPEMDGAALIKAVRQGEVGRKDLPIIALAGSKDAEARTTEAGADRYLAKPFKASELMKAVYELLRNDLLLH